MTKIWTDDAELETLRERRMKRANLGYVEISNYKKLIGKGW